MDSSQDLPPTIMASMLLQHLAAESATVLFGIPGGAIGQILNELDRQQDKFRVILSRHEGGATFMADAYARVTGKLGVVLVTSGPGATNTLTGAANANWSGSPMLIISGEPPRKFAGKGYLQEGTHSGLNLHGAFESVIGFSSLVSSEANFQTLFLSALRNSLGPTSRASHLSIPDDIAAVPISNRPEAISAHQYRTKTKPGNPADLQNALTSFKNSRRPVFYLGNGCRQALQGKRLQEFCDFAERNAIPVITSANAKGIFPESHPMSFRNFGLAASEWAKALLSTKLYLHDNLVVLGSSLSQLGTAGWHPCLKPSGALFQIDLNPHVLGRAYPLEEGIVCDTGVAIDEFLKLKDPLATGETETRRELLKKIKIQHPPYTTVPESSDAVPLIPPPALIKCIEECIPMGSHLFVDAGNSVGWSLHFMKIDPPTQIHYSLGVSPMGFAVAGVVGAKIGAPEHACIALVGDGAFLMHGTEISTATQERVGAVWIVLNDNDHSMVRQGQNNFFPKDHRWSGHYELGTPDLVKFSESLGAAAYRARTLSEAKMGITEAIRLAQKDSRPQVVVVDIDPIPRPPYYNHLPSSAVGSL